MTEVQDTRTTAVERTRGPESLVIEAFVSETPISVQALRLGDEDPSAGAVVTFEGVVRDTDEGRRVSALHYSAHPTAGEALRAVALQVTIDFPGVRLAVAHRVGELVVGDCALACVVWSAHRAAAFQACAELVERVKNRVPIWKEQVFDDGTTEWVNAIC